MERPPSGAGATAHGWRNAWRRQATRGSTAMSRISVIGLGYVGSVTAACLAGEGHQVIGNDINPQKVEMVAAGRSPVIEAGLSELIAEQHDAGRLTATTDTRQAIADTDITLICVGTPSRPNGSLDV